MKTLEEVMKLANERFDKGLKDEPDVYKECNRDAYLLGSLESEYKRVYKLNYCSEDNNTCPECGNPYPHLYRDNTYHCNECEHSWENNIKC